MQLNAHLEEWSRCKMKCNFEKCNCMHENVCECGWVTNHTHSGNKSHSFPGCCARRCRPLSGGRGVISPRSSNGQIRYRPTNIGYVGILHVRYVSTDSVTQLETLFLTVSVGSHSPVQAIRRSRPRPRSVPQFPLSSCGGWLELALERV